VDKFAEVYKATLVVFHGIIATWLFLAFSERSVDQFQFLILLVFFSVANILIWNLVLGVVQRIFPPKPAARFAPMLDLSTIQYRTTDVIALLVVSVLVGLTAAFVDRKDMVLRVANTLVDWQRTGTDTPFTSIMSDITEHRAGLIDKRGSEQVRAAQGAAYLRVYVKDIKIGYEGYPGRAPNKSDVREVVLTPACRFTVDANDPAKITGMQRVEGPGVLLRLVDAAAIEIIDLHQSTCANLP
jgi:hypothetical protein